MARRSKKGGKTGAANKRKSSLAKGRNGTKTRRRLASTFIRSKRPGVAGLTNELREAREQQAATAEILKVISQSVFDLNAVLEALVSSAVRLCEADTGIIRLRKGDIYSVAATVGFTKEQRDHFARYSTKPDRGSVFGRAILERRSIHVPDLLADRELNRDRIQDYAKIVDIRSGLGVPLLREGNIVGVFTLQRRKRRPYTNKQIELVETFANQAVIAIENTRLFEEVEAKTRDLQESLQQQTATADVLKVISRSAFNLDAVLQTLIDSAVRLCGATRGGIQLRNGDILEAKAFHSGTPESFRAYLRANPTPVNRGSFVGRAVLTGSAVHVPDVFADPEFTNFEARRRGNFRSSLCIPLMRNGEAIGVIALPRAAVGGYSQREIDLAQTFADQAVIAIENARLFHETREALERQTATAEVLQTINASPGDLAPVFDMILQKAHALCDVGYGSLQLCDGDTIRAVAVHGLSEGFANLLRQRRRIADSPFFQALLEGKRYVQIDDVRQQASNVILRASAEQEDARTLLLVPLRKEGQLLGVIVSARPHEVKLFTEKEIVLLEHFAAQAVIAIENARLINETREALERQTATAEILSVISRSPADLQPVFDAIASKAMPLCDATFSGLWLFDGDKARVVATVNVPEAFAEFVSREQVPSSDVFGRRLDRTLLHVVDLTATSAYQRRVPITVAVVELGKARTFLGVPLLRDGLPIGLIGLYREEVRPFSEGEIALVQAFAAQAVIAIENTRLFNETREALERQTATADVLKVIASSPTDLQPVFDAIAERSNRLIGGHSTTVYRFSDQTAFLASFTPVNPKADALLRSTFPRPLSSFAHFELVSQGETVQIPDYETADVPDDTKLVAQARGFHSCLFVPLTADRGPIGMISVTRKEPGAFAEHHVQLLKTFADQAVIAIQNVNLFEQVQARTKELSQSLDDLRTAQDRLVQTEKLASLGQLTAGIAHEIKNPLNFVNNFSALSTELIDEMKETLADSGLSENKREVLDELTQTLKSNLEKVVQHGKRADSIVKNMLLHSREGAGEHRPGDINAIVEDSLNLAYHGARAEKSSFTITLRQNLDPHAGAVELYPQEITRALLNLIANGFYAATRRKVETGDENFEPALSASTRNLGKTVEIRIRDNGTGIPPEVREKMFNPFFTTKPTGEGTGLGLSMTHDIIVKQHGGRIDVETEPGVFTEFIITLPRDNGITTRPKSE